MKNIKQINEFFANVTTEAYTWSQSLENLTNLNQEIEQNKMKLVDFNNQLQTCSLELVTAQHIMKNKEKKCVVVEQHMDKVKVKNKTFILKVANREQVARKAKLL